MKVLFKIGEYVDTMECDVAPMSMFQLLLVSWGAGSRLPPGDSHGQQLHGDMQGPKEAGG